MVAYLGVSQLGSELVLLLITGKLRVDTINLVTEVVDACFKLVLLLVGLSNQLVLHVHSVLALGKRLLEGLVNASCTRGDRQIALADLLLDLAGLLGLFSVTGRLVGVHGLKNESATL